MLATQRRLASAKVRERASSNSVTSGKGGRLLSRQGLSPSAASPSIIGMTPRPAAAAAASTAKSELVQTMSNFRPWARSAPVAAS